MARIATAKGVFLRPGVSKNGRRYTKDNIGAAVARMRTQLRSPDGLPVTMLSHHAAGDDSTRIVGRVTNVTQDPDGTAHFEADMADTAAARDIVSLTTGDTPFLRSVSIRGEWVGDITTLNGETTAPDLAIHGIDFTHSPGVPGARIEKVALAEAAPNDTGLIFESSEEVTITTENIDDDDMETATAPSATADFADPGYQKDKKKRYPLDSTAHVRAAWSFINMPANQKPYTSAQLKRIKGRIKAAAARHGVKITDESAAVALSALTEAFIAGLPEQITEAMATVSVSNGPADISVSAYGNDPADLQAVVGRLADAVLAALDAIDPDGDGDIDLPDKGGKSNESDMAPQTPDTKEPEMANTTEAIEATTPLTVETVAEMVKTAVAEALAAQAPVTETAPTDAATTTTEETGDVKAVLAEALEKIAVDSKSAIEAAVDGMRTEMLKTYGPPKRKGLVEGASAPAKPLHEMGPEELREYAASAWDSVLPNH